MQQNDNLKLFKEILADFNAHGILQDFILIGSWVLRIYKEHYKDSPQIPIVSTLDIDFLIPNPPKKSSKVDVPEILEKHGLEIMINASGTKMKFVSNEIEVEFIYAEKGSGEKYSKKIKELKIVATPLRYLYFIQSFSTVMTFKGMNVHVPEPEVFVLMKYLLTIERTGIYTGKIIKDIKTAKDLEFFLLEQGSQKKFIHYFNAMPLKWQKKLMPILKENNSELVPLFTKKLKKNTLNNY